MSLKSYLKEHPDYQQYDDKTLTEALYKKYGKSGETYTNFARTIEAPGATDDSISNEDLDLEDNQVKAGKAFIAARNTPDQTFTDKHGNTYRGDVGEPGLAYAANESIKQNISAIKVATKLKEDALKNNPTVNPPPPEDLVDRMSAYPKAISTSWNLATLNMERGRIGRRFRYGKETKEDISRLTEINTKLKQLQDQSQNDPYEAKAFATIAPFILNSAIKGGKGALYGATIFGVGALILGNATPLVAVPEEVVTVPLAMAAGAKIGASFTSVNDLVEIEQGSAYLDLLEAGIEKNVAGYASSVYAVGSGVLELAQYKLLKYLVPGGDKLARNVVVSAIRKVVRNNAAAKFGAQIGIVTLGESGVETTQEFTNNVVELAAKFANDKLYGTDLSPETKEKYISELTKNLKETFLMTATGFGITALPGASINLALPKIKNAHQRRKITNQMLYLVDVRDDLTQEQKKKLKKRIKKASKQVSKDLKKDGVKDDAPIVEEDIDVNEIVDQEAKIIDEVDDVTIDEMLGAEQAKVDEALDTKEKTDKEKLTTQQTRDIKVPDIKNITDPTKLDAFLLNQPRNLLIMR